MLRLLVLPLLAPLFVLAYGVLFLSSSPASVQTYIPYALVTGPMALVAFLFLDVKGTFIWLVLAGTYALYLVYGLLLRARARQGGNLGGLLMLIAVVHAACGMAFMYLSLAR